MRGVEEGEEGGGVAPDEDGGDRGGGDTLRRPATGLPRGLHARRAPRRLCVVRRAAADCG